MVSDPPLCFDPFELHPAERVLRVRGQPVAVGSRAFDVLLVLAQHHERLVTKQELLDRVWPGLVVEEHNIATQISTLRKLLGAQTITTLPGYGYRLTVPRRPAVDAADATTPPRPRHNLPLPRTRFIGREAAQADLARLLPVTRLLTLTGIGGCGKTRLALHVAREHAQAFDGGAWFVDLAPLRDAGRVAAACAGALGLAEGGEAPLMQRLQQHLATQRVLLVLDNCEHVLDGVVALVEPLLAAGGDTTILATSREALGLGGEQIYPVRSMALPATDEPAAVRASEAVRVFVDRARLAQPDFEVDAGNAAALAEICRRLDGIVLAIELAAARVTMLPVGEIARRLDDRFRLLTGGSRSLPRHRTLLATMQWSHEQLTPAEQQLLLQVSVFAAGWTLDAAVEVAQAVDEYDALKGLTALHDKSLIEVDRGAAGGPPRYRMLETVRQFALARLDETGAAAATRARHVAHFVHVAEEAERQVRGPAQDLWMNRFRQEHENLVAALTWCHEAPLDPQQGLRLVAACGYYWGWNSVELGYRLARTALEDDRAAQPTPAREATLAVLARLSMFRGRYGEALDFARQALEVARRSGEPRRVGRALWTVAAALSTLGREAEALPCNEEALELARAAQDGVMTFTVLNSIAASRHRAGDLEGAERSYREALDIARRDVGRVGTVVLLDNLVRVIVAQGRADDALRFASECLPLARGEKVGVDLLDACVGLVALAGDHAVAARFWGAADHHLAHWGYRREPGEREHLQVWLDRTRQHLGDEPFDAAQAAGRALPFEAAMHELERWLAGEPRSAAA